ASPLQWYGRQFVQDPIKGVVLAILASVWLLRFNSIERLRLRFPLLPTLLFWMFVAVYLINENYLAVHIFSASLCVAAFYCLLGMIMSRQQWTDLLIPFCLVILLLPFEGYLDIYLGFPLRLLCAEWAGEILQIFGFNSVSNESIILIEEKAANVDLGCSGIKGLWAGGIFYLLLSMIEGCRISWRWFAVGIGFVCCLLMANVLRIVLLVFLGLVAGLTAFADKVHVSLGLLGFSISCLLAWQMLRLCCREPVMSNEHSADEGNRSVPGVLGQVLFIIALLAALWLHRPYQPNVPFTTFDFSLPDVLQSSALPLTDVEREFFSNNHASTRKFKFDFKGISGSLLIVKSNYWKAQHDPRNCYLGQGRSLSLDGTWLLRNNTVIRFVQIDNATKTAAYWFQNVHRITPDYSSRVLGGIIYPQKTWLMVSILWEQPVDQLEAEKMILPKQTK
ncbi:MAG: exosortase O, partial [Candidatus Electrothrix sp. MAN1_4]|nr:exosortase O [Candidatus Electrothrix sp. MAN1_4]